MGTGQWIGDLAPEPDPPQEGRWIAKPRKARWGLPIFFFATFCGQLPNWLSRLFDSSGSPFTRGMSFVMLLVLFGVLFYAGTMTMLGRRLRAKDQATLDESFGDQFLVDVTVFAAGKGLGTDRGVLWFADGLMGFSGESMSFVLGASDLAPRWDVKRRPTNYSRLPADGVGLVNAPGDAYVAITPLRGKRATYQKRFEAFLNADERPEGERHWPPLETYAEEKPILEVAARQ